MLCLALQCAKLFYVMSNETTDFLEPANTPKKSNSKLKDTLSTLGIIIMAPIVALFLTNFIFQSYQVDGPSMESTLQNQDRLIVTKVGKTWARLTGGDYIPDRYEIIIFNYAGGGGSGHSGEKQLIKRVVGLPGDRVVVQDGVVKVFNKENPDGFDVDKQGPEKNTATILNTTASGNDQWVVGEGEVFVMGDNRGLSLDSRAFGPIKSKDILGHLQLRIYPFNKFESYK